MINSERLRQELSANIQAAPLPVVGWDGPQDDPLSSFHTKDGVVVRLRWPARPTPQQRDQAEGVVQAHDVSPTEAERLDAAPLRNRVLAALAIRTSSHWASLSAARRQRVQAVIDGAAADLIALLG